MLRQLQYAARDANFLAAVLNGSFRAAGKAEALTRLDAIRERYVCSKEQTGHPHTLRLWVRDYAVTEAEQEAGYRGHFVVLWAEPRAGGEGWTITAHKELTELRTHPQKQRPRRSHPDWGHPVLRMAVNGKRFRSLEEGQQMLERLQADYPKAALPGPVLPDGLAIIVWSSTTMEKLRLTVEPAEGWYRIRATSLAYAPRRQGAVRPPWQDGKPDT